MCCGQVGGVQGTSEDDVIALFQIELMGGGAACLGISWGREVRAVAYG